MLSAALAVALASLPAAGGNGGLAVADEQVSDEQFGGHWRFSSSVRDGDFFKRPVNYTISNKFVKGGWSAA